MKETLKIGQQPEQTVMKLLNKYQYFTSIKATIKSEALGLYFFLTTAEQCESGKKFITEQLPRIWAQLKNTFLEDLPESVKCPRLTTSNLRDESTTNTANMLAKAQPTEETTGESKWNTSPKLNKPPTRAVIVNYSEQDFPNLSNRPGRNQKKADNRLRNSTKKQTNMDSSSTHSNVSATSGGTTFTKEDGQSLFTSLTESFISDMKSQTEAVLQQNQILMALVASQADMRAEQTAQNANNDDRFERMLAAFMQHSTTDKPPRTRRAIPEAETRKTPNNRDNTQPTDPTRKTPSEVPEAMDTGDESDDGRSSMDTASAQKAGPGNKPREHLNHQVPTTTEQTLQEAIGFNQNPSFDDLDSSNNSGINKDPSNQLQINWQGSGTDEENEWEADKKIPDQLPLRQTQYTSNGNSEASSTTTHITSAKSLVDQASFGTVDSTDPTHEKYELQEITRDTSTKGDNKIQSPPKATRTPQETTVYRKDNTTSAKELREIKLIKTRARMERILQKLSRTELAPAQTKQRTKEQKKVNSQEIELPPNTPERNNIPSQTETQDTWSLVGSSKRKAKDTLTQHNQVDIRKSPLARANKKQIVDARVPKPETPAAEN
jgi:hypothetical protein